MVTTAVGGRRVVTGVIDDDDDIAHLGILTS